MARRKHLSASFVRAVKRPGRYGDGYGGHGLSLLVKTTKSERLSKTWSQRLRLNGKPFNVGLGVFPIVSLAEARAKALENRRAVAQGRDPRAGGIPTFEQAAERVLEERSESWRHSDRVAGQWRQSFVDYVHPAIGGKRVNDITSSDLKAILVPLVTGKPTVAKAVRQRVSTVLRWAIAMNFRTDADPTPAVTAALPTNGRPVRHHPALPHAEVGDAVRTIHATNADLATKLGIEFLVLTAARVSEVTNAEWSEVDLERGIWTVPASRSKTKRPHRVPLSGRALEVLAEARGLSRRDGWIFPTRSGRAMSRHVFKKLMRRLGIAGSPHGMRSAFRDWSAERGVDRQVAEACLAHVVKGVEGAYLRSDLYERRREVMQDWSDYLAP